eukprot:m.442597 g.442597  ORF g.442597 m.442597 type:complete len:180 (+) comp18826_c0_seq1:144-683(+)
MTFRKLVEKVTGGAASSAKRAYPKGVQHAGGQQAATGGAPPHITTIKSDPVPLEVPNKQFEQIISRLALDRKEAPLVSDKAAAARTQHVVDPAATVGDRSAPLTAGTRKMPQSRLASVMSEGLLDVEQSGRLTAEQVEMLLLSPIAKDPTKVLQRVASESVVTEDELRMVLHHFRLPPK